MTLLDAAIVNLCTAIAQRLRRVRLVVKYEVPRSHGGHLSVVAQVTNRSKQSIAVARLWLATDPPVPLMKPGQLPVIVSPRGTYHLGISAIEVPQHGNIEWLGRAELTDGRVLRSRL